MERKPSLLGLSMRMCEPEFAMENVWHVLDVLEGSPAESAGLVPYGDWIIGWSGGVLSTEGDFYEVVEAVRPALALIEYQLTRFCLKHIDKPLRVFVYSYDFEYVPVSYLSGRALNLSMSVTSERLYLYRTGTGVVKGFWAVSSGMCPYKAIVAANLSRNLQIWPATPHTSAARKSRAWYSTP